MLFNDSGSVPASEVAVVDISSSAGNMVNGRRCVGALPLFGLVSWMGDAVVESVSHKVVIQEMKSSASSHPFAVMNPQR